MYILYMCVCKRNILFKDLVKVKVGVRYVAVTVKVN